MSHELTPIGAFLDWLPGELIYSAKKAGYDKKIERAGLHINDPRSMYGFLGSEWETHQLMRRGGNHHAPDHRKTAQLQLAKFAAGLFDKAAIAHWLQSGDKASEEAFARHASDVGNEVSHFWADRSMSRMGVTFAEAELRKPFAQTTFSRGIQTIMRQTVAVAYSYPDSPQVRSEICEDLFGHAFSLGNRALHCYTSYAESDLTPDQYVLAPSLLAD